MQGEISGLSRSVSNLGSSFGTAIAGTILVSVVELGNALLRGGDAQPRGPRPARAGGGALPPRAGRARLAEAAPHLAAQRGQRRARSSAAQSRVRASSSSRTGATTRSSATDAIAAPEGARRRPGASPCAEAVRPPRQHRQRAAERGAAEQERRGNRDAAHLGKRHDLVDPQQPERGQDGEPGGADRHDDEEDALQPANRSPPVRAREAQVGARRRPRGGEAATSS